MKTCADTCTFFYTKGLTVLPVPIDKSRRRLARPGESTLSAFRPFCCAMRGMGRAVTCECVANPKGNRAMVMAVPSLYIP